MVYKFSTYICLFVCIFIYLKHWVVTLKDRSVMFPMTVKCFPVLVFGLLIISFQIVSLVRFKTDERIAQCDHQNEQHVVGWLYQEGKLRLRGLAWLVSLRTLYFMVIALPKTTKAKRVSVLGGTRTQHTPHNEKMPTPGLQGGETSCLSFSGVVALEEDYLAFTPNPMWHT